MCPRTATGGREPATSATAARSRDAPRLVRRRSSDVICRRRERRASTSRDPPGAALSRRRRGRKARRRARRRWRAHPDGARWRATSSVYGAPRRAVTPRAAARLRGRRRRRLRRLRRRGCRCPVAVARRCAARRRSSWRSCDDAPACSNVGAAPTRSSRYEFASLRRFGAAGAFDRTASARAALHTPRASRDRGHELRRAPHHRRARRAGAGEVPEGFVRLSAGCEDAATCSPLSRALAHG